MKLEVLLAIIKKQVEDRLEGLDLYASRGPRGQRGPRGSNGKDFDFNEHSETIKQWAKGFALKFEDLTAEQIQSLRGPQGRDGRDGIAGKDFNFDEHSETIKQWTKEFALKFEDLTVEQISSLRGPQGRDGKDGRDGHSFNFEENKEEISEVISTLLGGLHDSLKLKFSDLLADDIEELRGPRGRDGRDGKDFNFDEHVEYFNSLKPKFSDFTEEERNSLRLHFSQLTEEEKSQLKLKFEDLTDEDKIKIKGARGSRGQRGAQGPEGKEGKQGPQGARGLPGMVGSQGRAGINGRDGRDGRDGEDGEDAPYVTDIRVDQFRSDQADFIFEFSDGSEIRTNSVQLPRPNIYIGGGASSGGGSGSGTGADGKSAYEIAVENGFVGSEVDWLASLVGPAGADGADGAQGPAGTNGTNGTNGADGLSAYEVAVAEGFVGDEAAWLASLVGAEGPQGPPGSGASGILEDVPCDTDVYVGALVRLDRDTPIEDYMSAWTSLNIVPQLETYSYSLLAKNAKADTMENANVFGVVNSIPSPGLCNILFSGITSNIFFGLDVRQEYFLSPTVAGGIETIHNIPDGPGQVFLKIGQPASPQSMLVNRGERIQVS